jgi:hypothetical protein
MESLPRRSPEGAKAGDVHELNRHYTRLVHEMNKKWDEREVLFNM